MANALCSGCPMFWFCEICGLPQNEADARLIKHNAALIKENARLKELAMENGLTYGAGKNYIEGQES